MGPPLNGGRLPQAPTAEVQAKKFTGETFFFLCFSWFEVVREFDLARLSWDGVPIPIFTGCISDMYIHIYIYRYI